MHVISKLLARCWNSTVLVLICGLSASVGLYWMSIQRLDQAEMKHNIDFDVAQGVNSIQKAVQANLFYVSAVVGLFDATKSVDRAEFKSFTHHIMGYYINSLQALEWVPVVTEADRAQFEKNFQTDGLTNFHFTEKSLSGAPIVAAPREVYYPVAFVEPWLGNQKAHGFDLGSNPIRLAALNQARDSGGMVATAPIVLIQEKSHQHGFLIFAPIYRGKETPSDVDQRRASLAGFALGAYRSEDLLNTALNQINAMDHFIVTVRDVTEGLGEEIYNNSALKPKAAQEEWQSSYDIFVAGRHWSLMFTPTAHYIEAKKSLLPLIILLSGILISIATAIAFWNQSYRRKEAERFRVATEKNLAEQHALLTQLHETQHQMLQSEKMASIGQLAAGVAHEINNPIGFVSSNLGALKGYFIDLMSLIEAYKSHHNQASSETNQALEKIKKDIDIEYLESDVPILLRESEDGILRVKNIVQDLKDFSHPGSDEWEWADIEKGLESTLNVSRSELKYKATVIKKFGGIPQIECVPSQLNQVFLNLFVNAVQAINEHGEITVTTLAHLNEVVIEIADSGSGISEENLEKIFLPFFTTKPIGRGTGLGLSLSYSIVQKHHGRIEVESEIGVGTTFRIHLPIRQPPQDISQLSTSSVGAPA